MRKRKIENEKVRTEAWEQKQVIKWKRANQIKYSELQLLHASMNGVRISSPKIRKEIKEQGLEKGFPDLMLDVAKRDYHGLRIEMKRTKGGVVSKEQKLVLGKLEEAGYFVMVCKGCIEAIECICWYLDIPVPKLISNRMGVEGR
jgi:hypothetical protein